MKTSLYSVAACAALALSTGADALADSASFTGPALAVGAGVTRNQVEYGGLLSGASAKKNDGVLKLDASYGISVAPQWIVTLGASYDLNKTDFGSVNYVDGGGTYKVDGRLKNHYAVYVAPGYRLSDKLLAYAKLGWHRATAEFNDSQAGTGKTTHNGTGFGAGVSTALSRQLEARFEVQRVNYSRESANLSNGKPESTEATVYLGYRF